MTRIPVGRSVRAAIVASAILAPVAGVAPAFADLLGPREGARELPFEVLDGRPMIAARVGETGGRMMFDIGTPDAVFLNRDAVPLDEGTFLAEGRAASGQRIEVRQHAAPPVRIAEEEVAAGPVLRSGNFGFTAEVLGEDFLGFVGRPAVAESAFVLDYGRRVLTILATGPDGAPAMPAPAAEDVLARIDFVTGEAGLPSFPGRIGREPVTVDLDTGDGGTLYLAEDTLARLVEAGLLTVEGARGQLREADLGEGAVVRDLDVRLVVTGTPEDARETPEGNLLRLGAAFFARHVTLWNFPAGRIEILRPGVSHP